MAYEFGEMGDFPSGLQRINWLNKCKCLRECGLVADNAAH